MNRLLLPERMIRLISPADRKRLRIETFDEMTKKIEAKTGRELTKQLVQYLQLRGIEVGWASTAKKSRYSKGWPDITFAAMVKGFPMACAWEVKVGTDTLSREQSDRLERMQARPNCWRVRVIRTFIEAVDELREMGL